MGQNQIALNQQGIRGQGAQDILGISAQNEQNRIQGQQYNIGNTLNALTGNQQGKNQFNVGAYGLQNEALAKFIAGKAAERAANQ